FFQAEDGIRDKLVTGVQTCALPICLANASGNYVDRYSYLPFGSSLVSVNLIPNRFQFVGQFGVSAEMSDVSYMRARFFNATSGRSEERRVGKECRSVMALCAWKENI